MNSCFQKGFIRNKNSYNSDLLWNHMWLECSMESFIYKDFRSLFAIAYRLFHEELSSIIRAHLSWSMYQYSNVFIYCHRMECFWLLTVTFFSLTSSLVAT